MWRSTSAATEPARGLRRRIGSAVLVAFAGVGVPAWAALGPVAPVADSAPVFSATARISLLALRVNGVERSEMVQVLELDDGLAVATADWSALHLRGVAAPALTYEGQRWQRLDGLPGLRWTLDDASQTLLLDVPSHAFAGSRIGLDAPMPLAAVVSQWGGWGNLDLQWQREGGGGPRRDSTHALVELGAFGPPGAGRSTALLRDDGRGAPRAVRLETTWTLDHPERLASLRLGDAISQPGAWGRALRFGGLQWATDFSTRPGFLAFPLPALRGEAALPSTVEVYIDNSRRLQTQVLAGPFELEQVPMVTGSGQVRMVVRDLLGREQVVVMPYDASPALLRPGLRAFSYELGALREDYGLASGHYGRPYAAATERLGVSDTFTRELRAELLDRQATLGAGGAWLLGGVGLVGASLAASHSQAGTGGLASAMAERRAHAWTGNLQWRHTSRRFVQAGTDGATVAPRGLFSAAVATGWQGATLGLTWVRQTDWAGARQSFVSANLARQFGALGTLGLFALHDRTSGATTLALNLSFALDGRTSGSATSTRSSDREHATHALQLQRNIADGEGFGYDVVAEQGAGRRVAAQAQLRTEYAAFSGGIARAGDREALRAGLSTGLAWLGDSVFVARRIEGSFAVVEVGDYPDVRVLHDQRQVARTDRHGRALVPGLRGYEPNRIAIEAADLPFDAEVEALEVELVPPARSGVAFRVPVRRSRSASFRVVDAAGVPLPAGSLMHVAGRAQSFPVGYDGRAFVSGLGARTSIEADWPGGRCDVEVRLDGEPEELPDLGTLSCR